MAHVCKKKDWACDVINGELLRSCWETAIFEHSCGNNLRTAILRSLLSDIHFHLRQKFLFLLQEKMLWIYSTTPLERLLYASVQKSCRCFDAGSFFVCVCENVLKKTVQQLPSVLIFVAILKDKGESCPILTVVETRIQPVNKEMQAKVACIQVWPLLHPIKGGISRWLMHISQRCVYPQTTPRHREERKWKLCSLAFPRQEVDSPYQI